MDHPSLGRTERCRGQYGMSPADAAYWMTDNKAADDGADGWVSDVVGEMWL